MITESLKLKIMTSTPLSLLNFTLVFLELKIPALLCFYFHPVNKSAIFFIGGGGTKTAVTALHYHPQ